MEFKTLSSIASNNRLQYVGGLCSMEKNFHSELVKKLVHDMDIALVLINEEQYCMFAAVTVYLVQPS